MAKDDVNLVDTEEEGLLDSVAHKSSGIVKAKVAATNAYHMALNAIGKIAMTIGVPKRIVSLMIAGTMLFTTIAVYDSDKDKQYVAPVEALCGGDTDGYNSQASVMEPVTNAERLQYAQKIYRYLNSLGYTDEAIAGILSNAVADSELRADRYEGDDINTDYGLLVKHHGDWDEYTEALFDVYMNPDGCESFPVRTDRIVAISESDGHSMYLANDTYNSTYESRGALYRAYTTELDEEYLNPNNNRYVPGMGFLMWSGQRANDLMGFANSLKNCHDWDNDSNNDAVFDLPFQIAYLYYENKAGVNAWATDDIMSDTIDNGLFIDRFITYGYEFVDGDGDGVDEAANYAADTQYHKAKVVNDALLDLKDPAQWNVSKAYTVSTDETLMYQYYALVFDQEVSDTYEDGTQECPYDGVYGHMDGEEEHPVIAQDYEITMHPVLYTISMPNPESFRPVTPMGNYVETLADMHQCYHSEDMRCPKGNGGPDYSSLSLIKQCPPELEGRVTPASVSLPKVHNSEDEHDVFEGFEVSGTKYVTKIKVKDPSTDEWLIDETLLPPTARVTSDGYLDLDRGHGMSMDDLKTLSEHYGWGFRLTPNSDIGFGDFISLTDYITLINCATREYGYGGFGPWEKALVLETIFWNHRNDPPGYDLRDTIGYPLSNPTSERYQSSKTPHLTAQPYIYTPDFLANTAYVGRDGFTMMDTVNLFFTYSEWFDEDYAFFGYDICHSAGDPHCGEDNDIHLSVNHFYRADDTSSDFEEMKKLVGDLEDIMYSVEPPKVYEALLEFQEEHSDLLDITLKAYVKDVAYDTEASTYAESGSSEDRDHRGAIWVYVEDEDENRQIAASESDSYASMKFDTTGYWNWICEGPSEIKDYDILKDHDELIDRYEAYKEAVGYYNIQLDKLDELAELIELARDVNEATQTLYDEAKIAAEAIGKYEFRKQFDTDLVKELHHDMWGYIGDQRYSGRPVIYRNPIPTDVSDWTDGNINNHKLGTPSGYDLGDYLLDNIWERYSKDYRDGQTGDIDGTPFYQQARKNSLYYVKTVKNYFTGLLEKRYFDSPFVDSKTSSWYCPYVPDADYAVVDFSEDGVHYNISDLTSMYNRARGGDESDNKDYVWYSNRYLEAIVITKDAHKNHVGDTGTLRHEAETYVGNYERAYDAYEAAIEAYNEAAETYVTMYNVTLAGTPNACDADCDVPIINVDDAKIGSTLPKWNRSSFDIARNKYEYLAGTIDAEIARETTRRDVLAGEVNKTHDKYFGLGFWGPSNTSTTDGYMYSHDWYVDMRDTRWEPARLEYYGNEGNVDPHNYSTTTPVDPEYWYPDRRRYFETYWYQFIGTAEGDDDQLCDVYTTRTLDDIVDPLHDDDASVYYWWDINDDGETYIERYVKYRHEYNVHWKDDDYSTDGEGDEDENPDGTNGYQKFLEHIVSVAKDFNDADFVLNENFVTDGIEDPVEMREEIDRLTGRDEDGHIDGHVEASGDTGVRLTYQVGEDLAYENAKWFYKNWKGYNFDGIEETDDFKNHIKYARYFYYVMKVDAWASYDKDITTMEAMGTIYKDADYRNILWAYYSIADQGQTIDITKQSSIDRANDSGYAVILSQDGVQDMFSEYHNKMCKVGTLDNKSIAATAVSLSYPWGNSNYAIDDLLDYWNVDDEEIYPALKCTELYASAVNTLVAITNYYKEDAVSVSYPGIPSADYDRMRERNPGKIHMYGRYLQPIDFSKVNYSDPGTAVWSAVMGSGASFIFPITFDDGSNVIETIEPGSQKGYLGYCKDGDLATIDATVLGSLGRNQFGWRCIASITNSSTLDIRESTSGGTHGSGSGGTSFGLSTDGSGLVIKEVGYNQILYSGDLKPGDLIVTDNSIYIHVGQEAFAKYPAYYESSLLWDSATRSAVCTAVSSTQLDDPLNATGMTVYTKKDGEYNLIKLAETGELDVVDTYADEDRDLAHESGILSIVDKTNVIKDIVKYSDHNVLVYRCVNMDYEVSDFYQMLNMMDFTTFQGGSKAETVKYNGLQGQNDAFLTNPTLALIRELHPTMDIDLNAYSDWVEDHEDSEPDDSVADSTHTYADAYDFRESIEAYDTAIRHKLNGKLVPFTSDT